MSKEQIENEIKILNERLWEELKNDNFDEVDLILKKLKNYGMILRIEEDTEENEETIKRLEHYYKDNPPPKLSLIERLYKWILNK